MTPYEILALMGGALLFAISVGAPVIKLNTSITKLIGAVATLQTLVDKLTADNKAAHQRLWDRSDEHGEQLGDHETRITVLEKHCDAQKGGKERYI